MSGIAICLGLTATAAVAETPIEEPFAELAIDSLALIRGAPGQAPHLFAEVSSSADVTGPFTLYWATRNGEAPLAKGYILDGTGAALDHGMISGAVITDLDDAIIFTVSLSEGALDTFVRDGGNVPVESPVASVLGITLDAEPPTLAAAEIGGVDETSLILTLDKEAWGATNAGNWTVEIGGVPITVAALLFIPGTATIDLTVTPPIIGQDVVTVSYSGTGLVGRDGAAIAAFTDAAVTNNTEAGVPLPYTLTGAGMANGESISAKPEWTRVRGAGSDPNAVDITYVAARDVLALNNGGTLSGTAYWRFNQLLLNDCFVEFTWDDHGPGEGVIQVGLAADETLENGFLIQKNGANTEFRLRKMVATSISNPVGASFPPQPLGAIYRLERRGSVLEAFSSDNGGATFISRLTLIDTAFAGLGYAFIGGFSDPGIGCRASRVRIGNIT